MNNGSEYAEITGTVEQSKRWGGGGEGGRRLGVGMNGGRGVGVFEKDYPS